MTEIKYHAAKRGKRTSPRAYSIPVYVSCERGTRRANSHLIPRVTIIAVQGSDTFRVLHGTQLTIHATKILFPMLTVPLLLSQDYEHRISLTDEETAHEQAVTFHWASSIYRPQAMTRTTV